MKKSFFFLAVILLASFGLMAQIPVGTYKEWNKCIDELEVKSAYDFSGRKTVVILPVETSNVEIPKDKELKAVVNNTLKTLTKSVVDNMQQKLTKAGYKVVVGQSADYRDPNAIVIQLTWRDMDLGNRAMRAWVGFGAGSASFSTDGVIYDGDNEVISFSQRRISSMDMKQYDKLAQKGVKEISEDVAKLVLGL
ncbi:MAG: DUF4410 domain-containing protein [Bacteroidales bacterium]|nr:DUF4410 domain-containing protein [Bacteroidales bacterium]